MTKHWENKSQWNAAKRSDPGMQTATKITWWLLWRFGKKGAAFSVQSGSF